MQGLGDYSCLFIIEVLLVFLSIQAGLFSFCNDNEFECSEIFLDAFCIG